MKSTCEKIFKQPYEKVFNTITDVLNGKHFYIADARKERKVIKAHTNVRLFSWGDDVEITFRGGDLVKVDFNYENCKSFFRRFLLKREAEKLFKEVEKNLN